MRLRQFARTGFGLGVALLARCSSGATGTKSGEESVTGSPSELLPATELIREQVPGGTERQEVDDGPGPIGDADAVRSLRRPPADDAAAAEYVAEDPRIETAGRVTISVRLTDEVERTREPYDDHPDQDRRFDEAAVTAESTSRCSRLRAATQVLRLRREVSV